ncbi:hypothetical protein EN750_38865, partial [Mesorhizobium sp. M7A.F.Ca.ET.027.03.2.1]
MTTLTRPILKTKWLNRVQRATASLVSPQWRNVAGANIQIFHDKENAGSGRLTIVVPKMDQA